MISDYTNKKNLHEIIKPYHSSLEEFEGELKCINEQSIRQVVYPIGAYEFSYALAESLSNPALPWLASWQKEVLKGSIRTKEKKQEKQKKSWTDRFESLGATKEDIHKHSWQKATGILRICTVYTEDEKFEGGKIEVDYPELLDFMKKSLEKITMSDIPSDIPRDKLGVMNTKSFYLQFPQGINLRIDSSYIILPGEIDIFEKFNELVIRKKEEKKAGKLFFWVVLDSIDEHHTLDTTFVYRKLCGKYCNTKPNALKKNGLFKNATIGLEGAVIVRIMQSSTKKDLKLDKDDLLWGGSGWFVWVLTIYQRLVCTELANTTSGIGDFIQNEVASREIKQKIKKYRDEIIELETQWMYQEVASSTDIDYLYREFQAIFDIEKMWGNIRKQTELIAQHAEDMQTKHIQNIQTTVGIIVSTILILLAFFGSNFFEKTDFISMRKFVFTDVFVTPQIIFLITIIGVMFKALNWYIKANSMGGLMHVLLKKADEWSAIKSFSLHFFILYFLISICFFVIEVW